MLLQPTSVDAMRTTADRVMSTAIFSIGQTPVTPMTLVSVALIVLATLWIARLTGRAMRRGMAFRGISDEGTVHLATRLATYLIAAVGVGIALQTIGINLGALFAAGAFFAVALGFAMQNIAQNFVAGIILLVERTIKPGDVLEVEGRVVRVARLGLRATVARSRDEEDLIIPNSALIQNTVTNYTLRDPIYRLRIPVGVSYGSDIARVKAALREAALASGDRLASHDPVVMLTGFGESSVDFEVAVWIGDPWRSRLATSNLNEAIWWALKRAEISIPFPQRDLHLVSGFEALRPPTAAR